MNITNIPGFTAEASIYKTNRYYSTTNTFNAPTHGIDVIPQLRLIRIFKTGPCDCCMCDGVYDTELMQSYVENCECDIFCVEKCLNPPNPNPPVLALGEEM